MGCSQVARYEVDLAINRRVGFGVYPACCLTPPYSSPWLRAVSLPDALGSGELGDPRLLSVLIADRFWEPGNGKGFVL